MKPKTKLLRFAKMHGLGNDFIVMHTDQPFSNLPVAEWADRHRGIGFDQMLILEPSQRADYFCRIYNADGSEAEQCGNGLRCVARYIHEQRLSRENTLKVETKAGIFSITLHSPKSISINLGIPIIKQKQMEFDVPALSEKIAATIINVGNPHAILRVSRLQPEKIRTVGQSIATHTYFTQGANVGFMQIIDKHHIVLRTYERGAGETLACGSNACAAVVAGISHEWLVSPVTVEVSLGSLTVSWEGNDTPVILSGPAEHVFSGEIYV